MKLTSKGFPTTRCKIPSLDEVLEDDVEFHLESNDSDNDVYDDDGADFEVYSQITR